MDSLQYNRTLIAHPSLTHLGLKMILGIGVRFTQRTSDIQRGGGKRALKGLICRPLDSKITGVLWENIMQMVIKTKINA